MIVLFALLAFGAEVAAETPPAPPPIEGPRWLRRPSGEDFVENYPRSAAANGIDGRAVALCKVLATGRLDGCVITEEMPPGVGFGAATLRMMRHFRMTPQTGRDGASVEGATVKIPLVWRMSR
jgi:protein TonB